MLMCMGVKEGGFCSRGIRPLIESSCLHIAKWSFMSVAMTPAMIRVLVVVVVSRCRSGTRRRAAALESNEYLRNFMTGRSIPSKSWISIRGIASG